MSDDSVAGPLALLDWRRRVTELYAEIRASADPRGGWEHWRRTRAALFREHDQSPVPPGTRSSFSGPHTYAYDPAWRILAGVQPAEPMRFELPTSGGDMITANRFAQTSFASEDAELSLDLYVLETYGGGLFVPFADATSGGETYGAGRYLLDTIKGADLGQQGDRLVLDFNFAYQPSCSYDPRWACPLAPPANRLPVAVRAGERVAAG